MITFIPTPGHVVAMRLSGRLTVEDLEAAIAAIEAALARHKRIGMLADTIGFADVMADALAKDLRYSFGRIADWGRFPRNAVITDQTWLKLWMRTTSAFVPGVEARAYEPRERDDALAWVSAIDPD